MEGWLLVKDINAKRPIAVPMSQHQKNDNMEGMLILLCLSIQEPIFTQERLAEVPRFKV